MAPACLIMDTLFQGTPFPVFLAEPSPFWLQIAIEPCIGPNSRFRRLGGEQWSGGVRNGLPRWTEVYRGFGLWISPTEFQVEQRLLGI
jgi:hypothetical protein